MRTRSPVLTLGDSLADFMRTLGMFSASAGKRGIRTQLRDQMQRLFHTRIRLTARQRIGDVRRESIVAAVVASRTELWWNLDATGKERIEHGKSSSRTRLLPTILVFLVVGEPFGSGRRWHDC